MEENVLADTAARQIAAYPAVSGKEKLKRFVKGRVPGRKLAPIDPFSWPNAMLGQGLLAAFEATGQRKYLLAVAGHLKRWKACRYRIHYVDNMMNGSLALRMEEYADSEELRGLCAETQEACAAWLRKASRTEQGILAYRSHHPDWAFADTLGMVCPFLCRYGVQKGDGKLLTLGTAQLTQFLKKGMDRTSGLPYHGYDERTGVKYGVIGWGRACGWMLGGMAESLPWIPKESEDYETLAKAFQRLAGTVCKYRRPDGGFSWQLEALEGHRDSSAEGMIGSAIAAGMGAGLLEAQDGQTMERRQTKAEHEDGPVRYAEVLNRLRGVLQNSVSEGTVRDCLGECRGFAEYPQIYGSYPWGTGSVLEFMARCPKRQRKNH